MAKLEIQIQIRKMLKPSTPTPTPNHLESLKFSLFDQLAPPVYGPMLFYYLPITSSECNRAKSAEKCAKLQKSLAETLVKFYSLAGRIRKHDLSIHCNDEGVEYVETKVNADLAKFLREGPEIELLKDLLPWCVPPDANLPSSPLLGVQVNIFNCGGLVTGIQISHILADGFTFGTSVKEWVLTIALQIKSWLPASTIARKANLTQFTVWECKIRATKITFETCIGSFTLEANIAQYQRENAEQIMIAQAHKG
ncbi:acetyl-CoA-benzylalcohol acetyltransferase-like [Lycium barbarum]|uniref:acetyl-CoA-benzylalcohol acetyltransferase-like n=1 Tax=Lycium barbarum TaxID=112863 RepID=UPI00293E1D45|nr:acetyl-CoA-benzylalcohol acetyltransferase-like [Lycium barbarum]